MPAERSSSVSTHARVRGLLTAYDRPARLPLMTMEEPSNRNLAATVSFAATFFFLFAVTEALAQVSPAKSAAPAPRAQISAAELVRSAMNHDISNWEKEKNYTFVQRIEQRELDSDGTIKSTKSETEEIIFLYGQPYAHLRKPNKQPLSNNEEKKEKKKQKKTMKKRPQEGAAERKKELADFDRPHKKKHNRKSTLLNSSHM